MRKARSRGRLCAAAVVIGAVLAGPAAGAPPAFQMPPIVVAPAGPGGVRVTDDGLLANWYPGDAAARRPAILLLGGSEGGLGPGVVQLARDLAAHGFAVLQLAYFGAEPLPSRLDMVPLEYFDRALAWLGRQPNVTAVAVVGGSKGAEAALIVATRHPELAAVVAGSPTAVVWQGLDFSGGPSSSSWSLRGAPVPFLAYGPGKTVFDFYQNALPALPAHPEAVIPVERIKAPVLLVCGDADGLWPSCPMSAMIAQRLRGGRVTVLSYPDAGHVVLGPPIDPASPGYPYLASLGGTPEGTDAARRDAWPKVLAFLDKALAPRR